MYKHSKNYVISSEDVYVGFYSSENKLITDIWISHERQEKSGLFGRSHLKLKLDYLLQIRSLV